MGSKEGLRYCGATPKEKLGAKNWLILNSKFWILDYLNEEDLL